MAIRSPYNLAMLKHCLDETDPETTDVVVMTATVLPLGSGDLEPAITVRDRQLLTAVVNLAEHAGKPVKPVMVPTNEPFLTIARTAKTISTQELIMGQSNKYRPEDQLDQVANLLVQRLGATPEPLSIRVLAKDRDVRLDIAGGSQIPKVGCCRAETAHPLRPSQELARGRAVPPGLRRQSSEHRFSRHGRQLPRPGGLDHPTGRRRGRSDRTVRPDRRSQARSSSAAPSGQRALGRHVEWRVARGEAGPGNRPDRGRRQFDAIFMSLRGVYRRGDTTAFASNTRYVLEHAPCRVILGFAPKSIPVAPADAKV